MGTRELDQNTRALDEEIGLSWELDRGRMRTGFIGVLKGRHLKSGNRIS
jgi:hypothetical protein